jgi:4-amino-4-deoxy-L-arabinose transferase-like glycosyltransferase
MSDFVIRHKIIIISFLLLLFSMQSLSAITTKSATFDEVQYYGIGKYLMLESKWDIMGAILHPPLSYYLSSLPLLFVQEDKKLWDYDEKNRDLEFLGAIDFYRGQHLLSADFNKGDKLLIASRCMTLLLSLVLAIYIYRFSSMLFGVSGGLFSLFLFSFCPNMLAFSGICVPDMPLAVFTLIAMYYFWRSLQEDNKVVAVFAGLSLGLALLCKFPAMMLIPLEVLLALFMMYHLKRNLLPTILIIFVVAFLTMLIGYQGDLAPFIQGNKYRLMQQGTGQSAYLLGQYSIHGWWYFYPLAFLMKTPLTILLLFPIALWVLYTNRMKYGVEMTFLLAPIIIYLIAFSSSGYSIGLRYILPIYPFIFITIGAVTNNKVNIQKLLIVAAVFYVISSLFVAPHYLAYFNEAIGGPGNGYRFLVDSNLDWGQDLKGLKKFMDKNKVEKISLSYFGADDPQRYGIDYDWLPSHHLYNPTPDKVYDIYPDQLVAVSVTNLLGVYLEQRDMYKPLLQQKPVAKIGYSIYVYDLGGKGHYIQ